MRYHVLTLFPDMVNDALHTSILNRASENGLISMEAVNIRDFSREKHKKVDEYPYGGGAGMLMQAQPIYDAYSSVMEGVRDRGADPSRVRTIYMSPQGRTFTQEMARELAQAEELIFLCGHYEGVDERVLEEIVTDVVSIGDYVLTGGELPAMVMIDAISRMVGGVLTNDMSGEDESFHNDLLEYPQYTRPEVWHDRKVPDVLLSGDHKKVDAWRLEQSRARTQAVRPDMYERHMAPERAKAWFKKDKRRHALPLYYLERNPSCVLRAGEKGVLMKTPAGEWLLSCSDPDTAERMLSEIPAGDKMPILCDYRYTADACGRRWGRNERLERKQAVYSRKDPDLPAEAYCLVEQDISDSVEQSKDCIRVMTIGQEQETAAEGYYYPDGRMELVSSGSEAEAFYLLRYMICRLVEKGRTPVLYYEENDTETERLCAAAGMRLIAQKSFRIL